MLDFEHIKEYFPRSLQNVSLKGILTEYLQYEFLDSIYKQKGSEKLSFIGGTAVRIIHGSERFSEDLDFDNFGLKYSAFKTLLDRARNEMELKGFALEVRYLEKAKNYHAYVKFPEILFKLGISSHKHEKIFLSIDAEHKNRIFGVEIVPINKFGIFRNITVNPASVLLAQKLLAILYRKREKGRDFYDASFLAGKTKPDYPYITKLLGFDKEEFCEKITERCSKLNFKDLATDVEPFLFDRNQIGRVLHFKEALSSMLF